MSKAGVSTRAATLADVDQVVAIERASFSDPWSPRSFRDLIGRDDVLFDVAVREWGTEEDAREGVVGFVIVYVADTEGDLANIAIAASERGRGEGRRLLRHALAAVSARGVYFLYLEVRESNTAARALYQSEGFVEVGRRSRYYVRPVEDALILRVGVGGRGVSAR
ncbi:MAG: ribosomal protein S18-alanine N-acetyltransferase [Gemmatimonadaceae bacterium]|nr:ribosomal protein S18-alanine N-acetyltransferase [Gemmatimonadaceae bacterium]